MSHPASSACHSFASYNSCCRAMSRQLSCTISLPRFSRVRRPSAGKARRNCPRLAVATQLKEANPQTQLADTLANSDYKLREVLQDCSEAAFQALRHCPGNQHLSDIDIVCLLLRAISLHKLWRQQYSCGDDKLDDINVLVHKVASLTVILAGGSSGQTLQALERHPPLLLQYPSTVAERMIKIKQLIPDADVAQMVSKRPSILCMETLLLVSKLQKAARQLQALMPAIPWEGRLMQDSNLWMTFITLLDDHEFHAHAKRAAY